MWIFAEVLTGGLAVGTLLILARPRDEEAAALYRSQARRALTRLHDLVRSTVARVSPRSSSGFPTGGVVSSPSRRDDAPPTEGAPSDQGQRTPAFRSINSELASLPSCGSGDGSTY